jgi:DNA sulfur modification protein DndC
MKKAKKMPSKTKKAEKLPSIQSLIDRGAKFVINDSGGKDSQAMKIFLSKVVPHDQLVIVHVDLPEVDWEGCWEHVQATSMGIQCEKVTAVKTFFEMVERKGMFPSPVNRQCTSDLKRAPIEKFIRHLQYDTGQTLFVNCTGIRAAESAKRKGMNPFTLNEKGSIAGREWYEWMPIFDWGIDEVWAEIASVGQKRHYAYDLGMSRLSCVFCIMSRQSDLQIAAKARPALYQRYVDMERKINFTMFMPKKGERTWLPDIVEGKVKLKDIEPEELMMCG